MSTTSAPAAAPTLLDAVCAQHEAELAAGRAKMTAVVTWAAAHHAPGVDDLPDGQVYADHEVALAGPGAPGVSEFAVVELAAALAMSAASAKRYVGDALELAHRLPRLWARVLAGDLPAWRARTIAQRTKQLSTEAADWVDARVGPLAHRLGFTRLNTLIERAITLFDAETETEDMECLHGHTHVTITAMGAGAGGIGLGDLAHLQAILPLPEALALDATLAAHAHDLHATHPELTLDERRALALGHLAHTTTDPAGTGAGASGHHLALMVHLGEPDLAGHHLARVRTPTGAEHLVTTEAVATWCQRPGTRVTIKPVLDLNTIRTCQGYVPGPVLREQIALLSPTCAFPYCPIPAERCDLDHIIARAAGGPTSTLNLAPLCRLHHRAKTHTQQPGGWTYTQPTPGTYHWTSPTGHHYQRDRDGTTDLGVVTESPPVRRPLRPRLD